MINPYIDEIHSTIHKLLLEEKSQEHLMVSCTRLGLEQTPAFQRSMANHLRESIHGRLNGHELGMYFPYTRDEFAPTRRAHMTRPASYVRRKPHQYTPSAGRADRRARTKSRRKRRGW